jgi:hypothetical protein
MDRPIPENESQKHTPNAPSDPFDAMIDWSLATLDAPMDPALRWGFQQNP